MKFSDLVFLAEQDNAGADKFIDLMRGVTDIADNEIESFNNWLVNVYSYECFRDEGLISSKQLKQVEDMVDIEGLDHWMNYLRHLNSAHDMFDYLSQHVYYVMTALVGLHNREVIHPLDKKKSPSVHDINTNLARHLYKEYKKYMSLQSGLKSFKRKRQQ